MYGHPRRVHVNRAPNPADDAKANSDRVPDVYSIGSHFDRIAVLRLKYKRDLPARLEKMVKQEQIQNGVILAGLISRNGYITNDRIHAHITLATPEKAIAVRAASSLWAPCTAQVPQGQKIKLC